MAKYSKKVMGKEVGSASVYAEPHTMSGKEITTAQNAVVKKGNQSNELRPSIGNVFITQPETKTSGIKQRGHGAATKGYTSRGPMA
jgi:hypothetical protein